jgi:hypothetical protein
MVARKAFGSAMLVVPLGILVVAAGSNARQETDYLMCFFELALLLCFAIGVSMIIVLSKRSARAHQQRISWNSVLGLAVVCADLFTDKTLPPKPQDLLNPKHSPWLHLAHRWSLRNAQGDTVQLDVVRSEDTLRYTLVVTSFAHGVLVRRGQSSIAEATIRKRPSKETTLQVQMRTKGYTSAVDARSASVATSSKPSSTSTSKSKTDFKSKLGTRRFGLYIDGLSLCYNWTTRRWQISFAGTMQHSLKQQSAHPNMFRIRIDPEVYTEVTGELHTEHLIHTECVCYRVVHVATHI